MTAHHHRVGGRGVQQRRELRDVSQRAGRRRAVHVHESHGLVRHHFATRGLGADEQRARPLMLRRPEPGQQHPRRPPLAEQADPDQPRGDRVLQQGEIHAAGPEGRPHGHRRRERGGGEQAPRVAPPVAGAVAARDQQRDHERHAELPAVQDAARQDDLQQVGDAVAEHAVVPDRLHEGAHRDERD